MKITVLLILQNNTVFNKQPDRQAGEVIYSPNHYWEDNALTVQEVNEELLVSWRL